MVFLPLGTKGPPARKRQTIPPPLPPSFAFATFSALLLLLEIRIPPPANLAFWTLFYFL